MINTNNIFNFIVSIFHKYKSFSNNYQANGDLFTNTLTQMRYMDFQAKLFSILLSLFLISGIIFFSKYISKHKLSFVFLIFLFLVYFEEI
ncbi:MAG: hypothetical protein Q8807_02360 ['Waltheria sp.' little leaf phytoplasma]|nr:hypothetical protein ['Waltheria sp.' little leaf phytoplasma]